MNVLFDSVQRVDLREVVAEQRPTTLWKVRFVTNITFYLDKLLDAGLIGDAQVALPDYIATTGMWWGWTKIMVECLRTTCVSLGAWPCDWTACVIWVRAVRLVEGKSDACARFRELRTLVCYIFTSSSEVIRVNR